MLPVRGGEFPARDKARFPEPTTRSPDFTIGTDGASTDIISVVDFTDPPTMATQTLASEKKVTHRPPPIAMFNADWLPTPDKPYAHEGNADLSLLSGRAIPSGSGNSVRGCILAPRMLHRARITSTGRR